MKSNLIYLKKLIRYTGIYGATRTFYKLVGRLRTKYFRSFYFLNKPDIGLIGCGQFQFSTIAFFLSRSFVNRLLFCFDIDENKTNTLSYVYRVKNTVLTKSQIYSYNPKIVYIASNHFSHTEYAINYLNKDINVYCEKPISVNFSQFDALIQSIKCSKGKFYAGYNRPYSSAVQTIKNQVLGKQNNKEKFSINCFVSAHDIPGNHWYRNKEEGTRICGNVGHWLDLMINMYNWRGYIPKNYKVQIAYSNNEEPDDNITISITTLEGDLTSITITARSEPFEGINETINFQYDTIIAKIDDFRKLTIWDEENLYKKRYWPKDVGHKRSVMQPFEEDNRDLSEVIASTELMLYITEMVNNQVTEKEIELSRNL
ncbi:Gfo/Idh/MocA family oxidoreductase [Balneola vulgaris]|uniref:Gfo/Idh/MocA family oxidoreductase n=1 Tax=Balneola vulgaris TaxID=287535 RepID=UPI000375DA78|nr:Gfo/Idh/MocA family oxidoreductase [Balneola vulgaris]